MLTAEENVAAAALDRRREARPGVLRRPDRARRPRRTGASTGRPSSRAASSSASRSRARSSRGRRSSSPTSRPATSTRRPAQEILELLRASAEELRPDDGDGHPRRRARPRSPTAILFLADGSIVDELAAERPRPRSSRRWSRDLEPAMIRRSPSQGLLGRKLRTALTAIAIVLGVAMVTGTFVLTDSIDRAPSTAIFTEVYHGTDATVTRQGGVRPHAADRARSRRRSTSRCSARCAALPDVAARGRRRRRRRRISIGANGKAIVFGGAPNLGFSVDAGDLELQPADARRGRVADGARGRGRHGDRDEEAPRGRRRRSASRRTAR